MVAPQRAEPESNIMKADPGEVQPSQASIDAPALDPPAFKKVTKKNTGGRPTKLNEALIAKVCGLIRTGSYVETAAAYCGISKNSLYEWLRRGAREKRSVHSRFADALAQANATAEVFDNTRLTQMIMGGSVRALTFRMERRYRERWGPPVLETGTPNPDISASLHYQGLTLDHKQVVPGSENTRQHHGYVRQRNSALLPARDRQPDDAEE